MTDTVWDSPSQTVKGSSGHILYGCPSDALQACSYLATFGKDRIYYGAGVKFRKDEDGRYVAWYPAKGSQR